MKDVNTAIGKAKRGCLMCHTYRGRFRPSDEHRLEVLGTLDAMRDRFEDDYNELRSKDAPQPDINIALSNKRICMDAMHACRACDREMDTVNRVVNAIKVIEDK